MEQKHILGLDLGTNSIGWAVINVSKNEEDKEQLDGINCDGVRIIPMDAAVLGDFDKGNSKSQTADRTQYRSMRRLYERGKLRRERLHRVLAGFIGLFAIALFQTIGPLRQVHCRNRTQIALV